MLLLRDGREPEPVDLRVRDGVVVQRGGRLEPAEGEPVVDLAGRFVRHGLRDAHVHVVEAARARRALDLFATRTAQEVADLVAAAHARLPHGTLTGGGFRTALWPEPPTAEVLERAAPGRVVVLHSLDRHSAWLSPAALAGCGLAEHPSGVLREHEAWQALLRLPPPAAQEDDDAVVEAVVAAHARGLTALRDFSFEHAYVQWERLRDARGRLPLRVVAVVMPAQLPGYVERGAATGDGDAWLRVGPLKLFADGALGSRTARCLAPYRGTQDRGQQLLDPAGLREALDLADAARFAVAVHAIGDEATRDVLQALQGRGLRASVEHAQLLRREDLPLFAAAGVTASVQPAHLLDDAELVEQLWADTTSVPYAVRSLVTAGADVVLGSDAPVSPFDPWRSVAAAVHRSDGSRPPWHPEEAVPLDAALHASGARRLRRGDAADLVVLDVPDPAVLTAGDLAGVPVWATMLDGQWVHGPVDRA